MMFLLAKKKIFLKIKLTYAGFTTFFPWNKRLDWGETIVSKAATVRGPDSHYKNSTGEYGGMHDRVT